MYRISPSVVKVVVDLGEQERRDSPRKQRYNIGTISLEMNLPLQMI
jgi:hypothetical protein